MSLPSELRLASDQLEAAAASFEHATAAHKVPLSAAEICDQSKIMLGDLALAERVIDRARGAAFALWQASNERKEMEDRANRTTRP